MCDAQYERCSRRESQKMQKFDDTHEFSRELMDNGLKSFAALSKGLQAISIEAADYSRQAAESAASSTERLLASKTLDKAFEVQADYMKNAYEGFIAQSARMNDLYADMARDACLPFESSLARGK
jgi:hypothetical protein